MSKQKFSFDVRIEGRRIKFATEAATEAEAREHAERFAKKMAQAPGLTARDGQSGFVLRR
ncbi:MAG TPA: hypothetical protein VK629_05985 [Steroidobacteraceae bacterium]|nr:hypothetical protein [Steroidobacteraceae bacterium]